MKKSQLCEPATKASSFISSTWELPDFNVSSITVMFFGGSITQQKSGYRPALIAELKKLYPVATIHVVNAGMGNSDFVSIAHLYPFLSEHNPPDFLFIESAINDAAMLVSDKECEATLADVLFQLIYEVRSRSPSCVVVMLESYIDLVGFSEGVNLPKIWRENWSECKATVKRVPELHMSVLQKHFPENVASVDMTPLFQKLGPDLKEKYLLDFCHLTASGGEFVASTVIQIMIDSSISEDIIPQRESFCPTAKPFVACTSSPALSCGPAPLSTESLSKLKSFTNYPVDVNWGTPYTCNWLTGSTVIEFEGSCLIGFLIVGPETPTFYITVDNGNEKPIEFAVDQWDQWYRLQPIHLAVLKESGAHQVTLRVPLSKVLLIAGFSSS